MRALTHHGQVHEFQEEPAAGRSSFCRHPLAKESLRQLGLGILNHITGRTPDYKGIIHNFLIFGQNSYFEWYICIFGNHLKPGLS